VPLFWLGHFRSLFSSCRRHVDRHRTPIAVCVSAGSLLFSYITSKVACQALMNAKPDAPSGSSSHRARSATTARQPRSRRSPPSNLSVLITTASQEQRPAAAINTSDLNPTLFPRRDDGRVVLTPPWFTTSTDPPTIPQHTQDLNLGRRNEPVSRVSSHEREFTPRHIV